MRFQVLNLTEPAKAAFVKPGFYWLIPPVVGDAPPNSLPEGHISIVGPFETHEKARADALDWIHQTLSQVELKDAA